MLWMRCDVSIWVTNNKKSDKIMLKNNFKLLIK